MKQPILVAVSGFLLLSPAWAADEQVSPAHLAVRRAIALLEQVPLPAWIIAAVVLAALAIWLFRPKAEFDPPQSVFGGRMRHELEITGADLQEFEGLVQDLNAIWRAQDMAALAQVATTDMAARLNARLQTQLAQNKGWTVHELQLLRSELIEAWREGTLDHAQMNMRLSTLESAPEETPRRFVSREIWSFQRTQGSNWLIAGVRSVE